MCDVTVENFEQLRDEIVERIRRSAFVAIDAEYTALTIDPSIETKSLFDDGAARYEKMLHNASKSITSQVGLSIFHFSHDSGEYVAYTYNFYICPRAFASVDERFVCQASCLQFLVRHNFDFNKFARSGIPYLNQAQERRLLQDIEDGFLLTGIESKVEFDVEDAVMALSSQVAGWFNSAEGGKRAVGEEAAFAFDLGEKDAVASFLAHQQIRTSFEALWTFDSPGRKGALLRVKVVGPDERRALESEDGMADAFVRSCSGFTTIFRALVDSKKPLIGHNCFLDIMKFYQHFWKPLPSAYSEFKSDLTKMFPSIFDTKFISFELKKQFEAAESNLVERFASSNLEELFHRMKAGSMVFSPRISHGRDCPKYGGDVLTPHEAGFDAFMTGFVFVMEAHHSAMLVYLSTSNVRPLTFKEHLNCLKKFKNKVNVARASVPCVVLDGRDPPSHRPPELYVGYRKTQKTKFVASKFMNTIARKLSRYGSVDVKSLPSGNAARVAVATHRTARDILLAFQGDEHLLVTNFEEHRKRVVLKWTLGIGSAVVLLTAALWWRTWRTK